MSKLIVKKKEKNENKKKEWRLTSLYMGFVAGICAFFSAVLFILQLCGVNDSCIKIIGLILGLAIMILLGLSSKYSNAFINKIHNKKSLEKIFETCSLSGILVFGFQNIIGIIPIEKLKLEGRIMGIITVAIYVLLPLIVAIVLILKKDWNYNED